MMDVVNQLFALIKTTHGNLGVGEARLEITYDPAIRGIDHPWSAAIRMGDDMGSSMQGSDAEAAVVNLHGEWARRFELYLD